MFSPQLYTVYKFRFSDLRKNDLSMPSSKEELEIYKVSQQDNMLFRQIRLITHSNSKHNKYVVFVDAHGYNSNPEMFRNLILNGLNIGDRHFEFSERSPSMTRNCMLSFVDASIVDELNKRISMDIKIDKTVLAKYVGYRGLMFSSCHCFDNWFPKVIVVNDYYTTIKDQDIKYVVDDIVMYTDKNDGKEKEWKQKAIKRGIMNQKINAFDGCGIHHPSITKKVKTMLDSDTTPSSILWRAPFIKGVTHEFDYTKFFNEHSVDFITDIWGQKHSINDKMLILTESMYKGFKYFKKYGDIRDWENYWDKFKKYNHCIGVAKWNFSKEEEPIYTRANYQILQDLDLEYEGFSSLADYSLEWVSKILDDDIRYLYCFLGMTYDNHNPMNDYVMSILKNPEMRKEKCVREYLVDLFKKYIDDFKCGKIYLESCFKILCPDLIALAEHIGGLDVNGCLEANEFYSNNIDGDIIGEHLIERNPHICKSEHTVLNGVVNEIIEKYCGHLSNVCMINIKSLTPQRLNGADHDGDLVLLINSKLMINGVDKSCPIVLDIDDKVTTIEEEYNKQNLYNLVLRTMNSLIGETSNCATTYHNKIAKTEDQQRKYDEYVDLLSVINGKAIDFAKTGVIFNIPRYIAMGGKPLPYFMRYRSEYYMKQKKLSKSWSNMNRLAIDIEKWQKQNVRFKRTYKDFDYMIMVNDKIPQNEDMVEKIEKVYLDFCKEMKELSTDNAMLRNPILYKDYFESNYPNTSIEELKNFTINWNYYYSKYRSICRQICQNKQELANIAVYLCYVKYPNKNKKFMWKVAGDGILLNIKQQNLYLPKRVSKDGDFIYLGKQYKMMEVLNLDK